MSKHTKKVIFAAGGTGGHLFPAQALAEKMKKKNNKIELLFAGAKLSSNLNFDKSKFSFYDISSATPFGRNFFKAVRSLMQLLKGVWESFLLISQKKPDLVIGFGSYHSFPVLFAAAIKKVPLILFESNVIPGRVIKFFSRRALFTAVYLPGAKQHLKGKTVEVEIPVTAESRRRIETQKARRELGLETDLPTILAFGGSQGAKKINQEIVRLLPALKKKNIPFQLIHFTGSEETAGNIEQCCRELNIPCYVKKFESRMNLAWSAADLAICRSGALTVSELIHFEVPAILVPTPIAADQHQQLNALFIEQKVGGALYFPEYAVSSLSLAQAVQRLIHLDSPEKLKMKQAIISFKTRKNRGDLAALVNKALHEQQT